MSSWGEFFVFICFCLSLCDDSLLVYLYVYSCIIVIVLLS